MNEIIFREVTRETWVDFANLFESRGGPKSCWCMVWRATTAEAKQPDGESRRIAMKSRVDADVPIGILGYCDGAPMAWCSIAPRPTYRPLGGIELGTNETVWSLTCFFIKREFRGQGLIDQLLRSAIEHAARNGATVIEAYPVDADSPSYRFMGFVETFDKAGFEEVGRAGQRRHVMRLPLTSALEQKS
ncbi:MAG TPA: GNAT family N-acetyltransferase [Methylophilaceae bacterium]|jgi:GNAT superfamily N-acetyltransferase